MSLRSTPQEEQLLCQTNRRQTRQASTRNFGGLAQIIPVTLDVAPAVLTIRQIPSNGGPEG